MARFLTRLVIVLAFFAVGPRETLAQARRRPSPRPKPAETRVAQRAASRGPDPASAADMRETIDLQLQRLDRAEEIDADVRQHLREALLHAATELDRADEFAARAAQLTADLDSLPAAETDVRNRLQQARQESPSAVEADSEAVRAQRAAFEEEVESLAVESTRRRNWLEQFPDRQRKLADRLAAEIDDLAGLNDDEPASSLDEFSMAAERLTSLARQERLRRETAALAAEVKAYRASEPLLGERQELARLQLARLEQPATAPAEQPAAPIAKAAAAGPGPMTDNTSSSADPPPAAERARERLRETRSAAPELIDLAAKNAELAEEIWGPKGIAAKAAEVDAVQAQLKATFDKLKQEFVDTSAKARRAGNDAMVGVSLRRMRAALPPVAKHRQNIKARQADISSAEFQAIESRYERDSLADRELETGRVLQQLAPRAKGAERTRLGGEIRQLLADRADLLGDRAAALGQYAKKLGEWDQQENDLISVSEKYAAFIDERVLWVQSDPALGLADFGRAWQGAAWFVRPENWREVAATLWTDARRQPLLWLLAAAGLLPWIWAQRGLRRQLIDISSHSAESYAASIRPTTKAVCLTALIAGAGPAVVWFFGWRLGNPAESTDFAQRVGMGLTSVAGVYLVLECFRQACRKHGLGEAHFGWSKIGLAVVRRNMRWAMAAALPLRFVADALESAGQLQQLSGMEIDAAALGRLAFIGGLGLLALFAAKAMHPSQGAFQEKIAAAEGTWIDRLRHVWYAGVVLLALAPAALAASGYYYTARELSWRVKATLWLGLGLVVVHAFFLRWVLVARRKLAIGQARQRRLASQETAAVAGTVQPVPSLQSVQGPPLVDLSEVDLQAGRLLRGLSRLAMLLVLWGAWADVLPALHHLDHWVLWNPAGAPAAGAAAPPAETLDGLDPLAAHNHQGITLGHLAIAAIILSVAFMALQNLPGLLEIVLWQRLPLDAGARYAIAMLSRYAISITGMVVAMQSMGIGWSNVQWLAAAVTVGLGFGLQEIFANFISGLIILFERPVRVGDTVTVGDVSGTVSRIRIRATTIVDADRKELIVPNKEFITGKVMNWTLTDTIVRLVIKVGVVYGADPARVRRLLLETARQHPLVLVEPGPSAVLDAFGDNALNYELRVYVNGVDKHSSVKHDLNTAIDRAFNHEGIDAALKKRDNRSLAIEAGEQSAASGPYKKTLGGPTKPTGGVQRAA